MPKFRSVRFFVRPGGVTQIYIKIHTYTHIQVKLGISTTGCSPYVDFDYRILYFVINSRRFLLVSNIALRVFIEIVRLFLMILFMCMILAHSVDTIQNQGRNKNTTLH